MQQLVYGDPSPTSLLTYHSILCASIQKIHTIMTELDLLLLSPTKRTTLTADRQELQHGLFNSYGEMQVFLSLGLLSVLLLFTCQLPVRRGNKAVQQL